MVKLGKKDEVDLTVDQVHKMLELAKAKRQRDYLVLALMAKGGLRLSEVVGSVDKRLMKRGLLPGLRVEDLRPDGVWVNGKKSRFYGGPYRVLQPLPKDLLGELQAYAPKKGKIFPMDPSRVQQLIREYAKAAGIFEWEKIHPHRLRHFYITRIARMVGRDPFKVRDLARHKALSTTARYVADLPLDEKTEIVNQTF